MTLRYYVGLGTSGFWSGTEIDADRITFGDTNLNVTEAADQANIAFGGVVIDDPDGDYDLVGNKPFWIEEDAATPARIWTGFVASRKVSRGPYSTGAGRVWDCDLVDLNATLHFRLLRLAASKRPEEPLPDRLDWLIASEALAGLVYDNGFIDPGASVFPPADYRWQYADDVIRDVNWHDRNVYVFWDESAPMGEEVTLYFMGYDASDRSASISISNVASDINGTTVFAPYMDASLERDPSDVYSGVNVQWSGGDLYGTDPTTADTYFPREINVSAPNIGKPTTAALRLSEELTLRSTERDTITCTLRLPKATVNAALAGQRIEARFSHLPGYESATYMRIVRRTVRQYTGWDFYEVDLELATRGVGAPGGGGPPGPKPPCPEWSIVQSAYAGSGLTDTNFHPPLADTPMIGDVLLAFWTARGGLSPTVTPFEAGWTAAWSEKTSSVDIGDSQIATGMYYRTVGVGDGATWNFYGHGTAGAAGVWLYELSGVTTDGATVASTTDVPLTWTPTAGNMDFTIDATSSYPAGDYVMFGGGGFQIADFGHAMYWTDPNAGTTVLVDGVDTSNAHNTPSSWPPIVLLGYRTTAGDITGTMMGNDSYSPSEPKGFAYGAVAFAQTTDCPPPSTGQWVFKDVPTPAPDGTTTTFTTTWPFAAGSLTVWVDRLNQTAALVDQDNATGEFTLAFAPKVGELIECDYQGI